MRVLPCALLLHACFLQHELPLDDADVDAAVVSPCASDPRVPEWLIGEFQIVGSGGRCLARDDLGFAVDECGQASWWFYDIDFGGYAEGEAVLLGADHFELRFDDASSIEVRRSVDRWQARDVLWVEDPHYEIDLWAVRIAEPDPVPVPDVFACLVWESWSLHQRSDAPALASGESRFTEPATFPFDDAPLGIEVRDGVFYALDNRLPLCGPTCARVARGPVVAWDGRTGGVRYVNTAGLCADTDGEVTFTVDRTSVDGTSVTLEQDWVVIDVHDADADGDTTDRLIRKTHSVLSADLCPSR